MKPVIQCVLTQWKPGFMASGSRDRRVENSGARAAF
jgi:hypothetical protein